MDILKLIVSNTDNCSQFNVNEFQVICVDVQMPGHGDVQGNKYGSRKLCISRQNTNHFVPLIRDNSRGHTSVSNHSIQSEATSSNATPSLVSHSNGSSSFEDLTSCTTTNSVPDFGGSGALLRADRIPLHAVSTKRNLDSSEAAQSIGMQLLIDQGLDIAPRNTLKTLEWLSARALLTEDCDGTAWKFQGMIVEYDEQPRKLPLRNSNSSKRARIDAGFPSVVRYIKCLDCTGPANIILWGESSEVFQTALQSTVLSLPSVKKWYITVERVRVSNSITNDSNGNILTSMRSIHSIVASAKQKGFLL